jgi:hypothetical protein
MPRPTRRKAVVIAFDAALYPAAAVRGAAQAFAEVATVTVKKVAGRHRVTLAPAADAPEAELLAGEFGNYALGLACQARAKGA